MHFELITPEKVILKEDIDELIVNTSKGQIAILPHHVSLMTKVTSGELIVKKNGKEQYIALTGGFLEVQEGIITLLADYAIRSEEIEIEKALKAQERAKEMLKKKEEGISERDYAIAQSELLKSILEIHVGNKRRKSRIQ
jgi:F-type H+-transporting ATPase subunit epsilon